MADKVTDAHDKIWVLCEDCGRPTPANRFYDGAGHRFAYRHCGMDYETAGPAMTKFEALRTSERLRASAQRRCPECGSRNPCPHP